LPERKGDLPKGGTSAKIPAKIATKLNPIWGLCDRKKKRWFVTLKQVAKGSEVLGGTESALFWKLMNK